MNRRFDGVLTALGVIFLLNLLVGMVACTMSMVFIDQPNPNADKLMYGCFYVFSVFMVVMVITKSISAYHTDPKSNRRDYIERMTNAAMAFGLSVFCWCVINDLDYTLVYENARLFIVIYILFVLSRVLNNWFAREDSKTHEGENNG